MNLFSETRGGEISADAYVECSSFLLNQAAACQSSSRSSSGKYPSHKYPLEEVIDQVSWSQCLNGSFIIAEEIRDYTRWLFKSRSFSYGHVSLLFQDKVRIKCLNKCKLKKKHLKIMKGESDENSIPKKYMRLD